MYSSDSLSCSKSTTMLVKLNLRMLMLSSVDRYFSTPTVSDSHMSGWYMLAGKAKDVWIDLSLCRYPSMVAGFLTPLLSFEYRACIVLV